MKTLIASVATAALLAAAVAHGQSAPSTLHLTQKPGSFTFVDAPPRKGVRKPSPGDTFVIVGKDTGDDTGTTHLVCTVTSKAGSDCQGVARLSRGTLTVEGFSAFAGDSDTYAVTGGSGAYAGRTGVAVVTGNDTDDIAITFSR